MHTTESEREPSVPRGKHPQGKHCKLNKSGLYLILSPRRGGHNVLTMHGSIYHGLNLWPLGDQPEHSMAICPAPSHLETPHTGFHMGQGFTCRQGCT